MKISHKRKNNRFFLILLTVALLCCLLNSMAYRSGVANVAANVLGVVVTPVQKLFSGVHSAIESGVSYFRGMDELKDENRRLQEEITSLRRTVSEMESAQKENGMLYNFLELKRERDDFSFVNAEIISRSVSNYTSEFTIDKGSLHGLEKDMAVLSSDNSLLGIITEVGATYARGKTLTSYDFSLGIKNERTGQPGIVSGTLALSEQRLCRVEALPDTADYAVGDIIRTSGLGDIYPPGLYVGTVTELVSDPLSYTLSATVKPSGGVFDTDMVMVLTDFDRTYEAADTAADGEGAAE